MTPTRKLSRRSFLTSVTGAAAGGGAMLALSDTAFAFQTSGCSDADPTDPGGNGRRCAQMPRTGCSDSDPTDPSGRGQRCGAGQQPGQTGVTDRDYGASSDPSGRGRGGQSDRCAAARQRLQQLEQLAEQPQYWDNDQVIRALSDADQVIHAQNELANEIGLADSRESVAYLHNRGWETVGPIASAHGIPSAPNANWLAVSGELQRRASLAMNNEAGRQQLHQQIAEQRNALSALGC
jgi:hypothetical protein